MSPSSPVRRDLVLAICCISLLIVGMDVTIVNIALPSIRSELHASVSGLQWTIDAYTLVIAALLMLAGSTGDRVGRRRVFQTGLATFTLGSLMCSLAPSLGWLIAARAIQAIGGSMLNPVAMSIITNLYTEPRERARAVGIWGSTVGISMAIGPVVGGLLVETVGWRGIFWINIPIGGAALALTAFFLPESRAQRARPPDPIAQGLIIIALGAVTYAIIEAPRAGWGSAQTAVLAVVALIAVAGLVRVERRRSDPLIDLRFFSSVPFSGATVIAVLAFGAFAGFLFLNTLYLQDVRGLSAVRAGLCTLPTAGMLFLLPPVSGRIVGVRGPRIPLIIAGIGTMTAGVMLLFLSRTTPLPLVLGIYAVFGIGFGMVNAPITTSAVSGMPNSQAGVAAAIASTSRQVGSALGVAIVGSVLNSGLSGRAMAAGFASASRPGWWILVGCGIAVLVLGVITTSAWAGATRKRTAHLFAAETPVGAPV